MKYQVRYKDIMSDKPMSEVFESYEEAQKALVKAEEEIKSTWATPDISGLYINSIREQKHEYNERYQRENIRQVKFKLNRKTDAELIEWIEGQENVNAYLKDLVEKDMEKKKAGK